MMKTIIVICCLQIICGGNEVFEYASRTFYPNLPEEIKEKYKIHDLIKYMPKEAFRLDDY